MLEFKKWEIIFLWLIFYLLLFVTEKLQDFTSKLLAYI